MKIMKSLEGYSIRENMHWITLSHLYTLAVLVCALSQRVTTQGAAYRPGAQPYSNNFGSPYNNNQWQLDQFQSSGSDGRDFEDDEEPMSSGTGPVNPPVSQPASPGAGGDSQGGTGRGNTWDRNDDDLFDSWRKNKHNSPGSGNNNNRDNMDNFPYGPRHEDDDEDDLYEPSGDIILEPERKGDVPNVGGEVRVDPPTQYPPYIAWPTDHPKPPGEDLRPVDRFTPHLPSDPFQPTTAKDLIVRPDGDWSTDHSSGSSGYKGSSPFFKIFNDPLVLAGIVSGAVLALLCIVLLVMFMIYRMRKKDEGSYALGEPKRTYDIRYTRTKDQEFFA